MWSDVSETQLDSIILNSICKLHVYLAEGFSYSFIYL